MPFDAAGLRITGDEVLVRWRSDVGEVIDYLSAQPEYDVSSASFLGYSLGGIVAPQLLAAEKRLQVGIIIAGGTMKDTSRLIGDNVNFLPRIEQPTLVLADRRNSPQTIVVSWCPILTCRRWQMKRYDW